MSVQIDRDRAPHPCFGQRVFLRSVTIVHRQLLEVVSWLFLGHRETTLRLVFERGLLTRPSFPSSTSAAHKDVFFQIHQPMCEEYAWQDQPNWWSHDWSFAEIGCSTIAPNGMTFTRSFPICQEVQDTSQMAKSCQRISPPFFQT